MHAFACTFRQVWAGRIGVCCGFDVPASSISSLCGFGSIIENTRDFSVCRAPRASRTGLASASAKVSSRPTSRPLILCRTTRACSGSLRALVFRESFHFFAPFFSFFFLFFQPFLGPVTTASPDRRRSCVPHL